MRNPFRRKKQRGPLGELIDRYGDERSDPTPGEEEVVILRHLQGKEGTFICVDMDAANPRLSEWEDEHPFATEQEAETATRDILIEHTVNPHDESLPDDARYSFFELDDYGTIVPQDSD